MSSITVYACDGCGKETRDFYDELNWLLVSPHSREATGLALTRGRNVNGTAVTWFKSSSKEKLFCSPQCLVTYLKPRV